MSKTSDGCTQPSSSMRSLSSGRTTPNWSCSICHRRRNKPAWEEGLTVSPCHHFFCALDDVYNYLIDVSFFFSRFSLSCRHGVFRGFNGGSGPSPHGKRLRTRSRHHLFLESKPSRRAYSTTKRRVLDKKEKKKN
jgi:hypothetical protein